jgi:regulator of sirC expression with transglutaminase-like and TPR domain
MDSERLAHYLNNPDDAFRRWHECTVQMATGMADIEFTALPEPLEEIKREFSSWMTANYERLHQIICDDWGYRQVRDHYPNQLALAVALVAQLSPAFHFPVELAALLVLSGLDNLCVP